MAYGEETKSDSRDTEASGDLALVEKMQRMFKYCLEHPTWKQAREDMQRCHEYKEGNQWTTEELEVLKIRKQPPTVNNLVAFTVSKLVGDLVDQRVRIGFRGRAGKADEDVARILSDIFLYIRQSNDLEYQERDMAEDGFTGGFGTMDAYVEFDDLNQPEIFVRSDDSSLCFPDPDSRRYDWNEDAGHITTAKWLSEDEAIAKFPKSERAVKALLDNTQIADGVGGELANIDAFRGDDYVDKDNRRIRFFETQYKKYKNECIYLVGNGQVIAKDDWSPEIKKQLDVEKIAYEKIERVKPRICVSLWGAGMMLEHKETNRKYFSKIPYFCYRKKNGAPYSLISLALSMQDSVNKYQSKAQHLLSNQKIYGERNALGDVDKLAEENAKPDGILEFEDGALQQDKVKIQDNIEMGQGQLSMFTTAVQSFFNITGVNPNSYQQTGELRSGTGLKTKFAEASKPVAAIFDNLKRSRKILGRVLLDLVQNYFTQEKVFMVTDNPQDAAREVTVSSEALAKIKSSIYDVTVDDFDDSASVHQEQYALFMQYLPQWMGLDPYWKKKVIQMSDLRDKDAIVADLDKMGGPPPVEPRVSVQANINELPPNERAFFYKRMGDDQLAAEVAQVGAPTTTETKVTAQIAQEAIKARAKPEPKEPEE